LRITILVGGSSEREISLLSGKAVKKSLLNLGHSIEVIDIKDQDIFNLKNFNTDLVFIALHGGIGENGIIQSLCEFYNMPYTGSGVLASALAMNKVLSKRVFKSFGINVAEGIYGKSNIIINNNSIGYPYVIKPIDGGSSIGIYIIKNKKDINNVENFNNEILIEPYIEGREVSATVFNNKVLGIVEIIYPDKLYDYNAKYSSKHTKYVFPKDLNNEVEFEIHDYALKAHKSLGCKGLTRADFRLDINNNLKPILLEINTLPGLTDHSLVPKIAKNVGIDFDELISMIIEDALN
tara:strand:- start:21010 stop:21891 length:882 start_codon:yes stop_codon:yes gene_type:complete